ncbi:MAG: DUF5611 family protein [Methermicoccaceae archaeon]
MRYRFKRGYSPDIERIKSCLEGCFSCDAQLVGGKCTLSSGALEQLEAWVDGKMLCIKTVSNVGASDEQVLDTNKRFREFLTVATGYTTKERVKQAKKGAEKK